MHIFFTNHVLVHEPSNLYPSGFHHYKKDRKLPPFIDIAAGDSQIFDICSTTNITSQRNIIRFEDYFNYSRKEAKNNPFILNSIKEVYIKLFAYADNSNPIETQYKIYKNEAIDADEWRKIDIKEFKMEKQKDVTIEIYLDESPLPSGCKIQPWPITLTKVQDCSACEEYYYGSAARSAAGQSKAGARGQQGAGDRTCGGGL